jgi:hypothetical protein
MTSPEKCITTWQQQQQELRLKHDGHCLCLSSHRLERDV